jgi:hypothetical protein
MTKIIELILTEQFTGLGKEDDPCRILLQLWTKDGKLIAQHDSTGITEGFFRPDDGTL